MNVQVPQWYLVSFSLGWNPYPRLTLQLHKEQSGLITGISVLHIGRDISVGVRGYESSVLHRPHPELMDRLIYVCIHAHVSICIHVCCVNVTPVMLTRYAEPPRMYGPLQVMTSHPCRSIEPQRRHKPQNLFWLPLWHRVVFIEWPSPYPLAASGNSVTRIKTSYERRGGKKMYTETERLYLEDVWQVSSLPGVHASTDKNLQAQMHVHIPHANNDLTPST